MSSRTRARPVVLALLVFTTMLLGVASPAAAQESRSDKDIVVLTGGAHIASGRTVSDLVVFDGDVTVEGEVRGNIVTFNGDVSIEGEVGGDVFAFNGRITVGSGAVVDGDVESRYEPTVASGATVGGDVGKLDPTTFERPLRFLNALVWTAITVSLLLIALALAGLFPRAADALALAGRDRVGASIGWGFAAFFGIPIVAVLLLVTVVGIPLGIALLLGIAPLWALGYAAGSYFVGRMIVTAPRSRLLSALVGVLVVRVVSLVPILGGLLWFAATIYGLGMLWVAARSTQRAEVAPTTPVPA